MSMMSPPAENARPSDLTTTAATAGSSAHAASAFAIALTIAWVTAFSAFGRVRVMMPALPARSKRTWSLPPKSMAGNPLRRRNGLCYGRHADASSLSPSLPKQPRCG
jgi:hypothetical protein